MIPLHVPSSDEIREILMKRVDHQKQAVGIVVGVIEPAGRRVVAYGSLAKDDSCTLDGDTIFEIGSISKVFTSLLLADMVNGKEVALDDPAARYLPEHVRLPERSDKPITLIDLSTHRSGLPPFPSNLKLNLTEGEVKDAANPYADYSVDDLYQFLSGYTLPRDPGSEFEYSNLGAGLLGHLLGLRAGTDYQSLIRVRITQPLHMTDTSITASDSMKRRMATGHRATLAPIAQKDWAPSHVFAGAGALRSSANDMLTFLEAFLGYRESPLTPAMKSMLKVRRAAGRTTMGLGWFIYSSESREIAWHNGGTAGFRSFVGYDPNERIGVVVLSNAFTVSGVDDIGFHLLNPKAPLADIASPEVRTEIAIDPKLLDNYTGRYQLKPNFLLEITREGDRLFAQALVQTVRAPKFELFAESETKFFARVSDRQITFETDVEGYATSLTVHQAGRETMEGARLS